MKVSLFDYTGAGRDDPADYAAAVLIFTKSTRLERSMSPELFHSILSSPKEEKERQLAYMADTVPSSWEFCDYSFIINDVTRAFTHQLVRTRNASYAQQAMRIVDMSEGFEYGTGPTITASEPLSHLYDSGMQFIQNTYADLVQGGAATEDARGILPTNILTNICVKINMRAFVDLCRKRASGRVQQEYRDVLAAMRAAALGVHPWLELFLSRTFDKAAMELNDLIAALPDRELSIRMLKLLDLMRTQS
jgi:flavin-dependent thymidylate synthase